MSQTMRLYSQAQAAGYSCVGYVQMAAVSVKWLVVYTSLAGQLGFYTHGRGCLPDSPKPVSLKPDSPKLGFRVRLRVRVYG